MSIVRNIVKSAVPAPMRRAMRGGLMSAARNTTALRLRFHSEIDERFLAKLLEQWGNPLYAAPPNYLKMVADAALNAKGSILECGTGLSTLVLGKVARDVGVKVVSLEHHHEWAQEIQSYLRRFGLGGTVCHAPLISHGDFDWYDVPQIVRENSYSVVVCDGPPGTTRGGRVGLVPVMKDQFMPDVTIYLDDAEREGERAVLRQWSELYGTNAEMLGRTAVVRFAPTV